MTIIHKLPEDNAFGHSSSATQSPWTFCESQNNSEANLDPWKNWNRTVEDQNQGTTKEREQEEAKTLSQKSKEENETAAEASEANPTSTKSKTRRTRNVALWLGVGVAAGAAFFSAPVWLPLVGCGKVAAGGAAAGKVAAGGAAAGKVAAGGAAAGKVAAGGAAAGKVAAGGAAAGKLGEWWLRLASFEGSWVLELQAKGYKWGGELLFVFGLGLKVRDGKWKLEVNLERGSEELLIVLSELKGRTADSDE
ncbi:hypothetical protein BT69DRAFT_1325402 [Atractiella rhizophila]|nr:hypothetical protein BT69DRAFT_1325402 [Atractiella rhizophila]